MSYSAAGQGKNSSGILLVYFYQSLLLRNMSFFFLCVFINFVCEVYRLLHDLRMIHPLASQVKGE